LLVLDVLLYFVYLANCDFSLFGLHLLSVMIMNEKNSASHQLTDS